MLQPKQYQCHDEEHYFFAGDDERLVITTLLSKSADYRGTSLSLWPATEKFQNGRRSMNERAAAGAIHV
jgi:hypothetical protein